MEKNNKKDIIEADIISRPNALNGLYEACKIGLTRDDIYKINNIYELETLQLKADYADKVINLAKSNEKKSTQPINWEKLGESINQKFGTPISRTELLGTIFLNLIYLVTLYSITFGVWGLVFQKNFFTFFIIGGIIAFLIQNILLTPILYSRRKKEQVKNLSLGMNLFWVFPIKFIFFLGILILIIKYFI